MRSERRGRAPGFVEKVVLSAGLALSGSHVENGVDHRSNIPATERKDAHVPRPREAPDSQVVPERQLVREPVGEQKVLRELDNDNPDNARYIAFSKALKLLDPRLDIVPSIGREGEVLSAVIAANMSGNKRSVIADIEVKNGELVVTFERHVLVKPARGSEYVQIYFDDIAVDDEEPSVEFLERLERSREYVLRKNELGEQEFIEYAKQRSLFDPALRE